MPTFPPGKYLEKEAHSEVFFLKTMPGVNLLRQELEKTKEKLRSLRIQYEEQQDSFSQIQKINSSKDVQSILNLLEQEIRAQGLWDSYIIALPDEKKENLQIERLSFSDRFKNYEAILQNNKLPLNTQYLIVESFRENKKISITSQNIEEYKSNPLYEIFLDNSSAVLSIPLCDKIGVNEPVGSLFLCTGKKIVTPAQAARLEKTLKDFYLPLQKALSYEWLVEREKEYRHMADRKIKVLEIAEKINNLASVKLIYKIILQEMVSLFPFDLGVIFIAKKNRLEYAAGFASPGQEKPLRRYRDYFIKHKRSYELNVHDGAVPTAFMHNDLFFFEDVGKIKDLPMSQKDQDTVKALGSIKGLLLVPLLKNDKPIGVLVLTALKKKVTVKSGDLKTIRSLCDFIGSAINNAELYTLVKKQQSELKNVNKKLKELSITDGLTELFNHTHFIKIFNREFRRAQRYKEALSLLMIDIDDFKKINDRYGHLIGDTVLHEISRLCKRSLRETDSIGRYGGEEFIILLPQTDLEGAKIFAERLRNLIKDLRFSPENHESFSVTISTGVMAFSDGNMENAEQLIEIADCCLYRAKNTGKDKVVAKGCDRCKFLAK